MNKYHVELTRVGRHWSWMVTHQWANVPGHAFGSRSTGKMLICESSSQVTLTGAKAIAYAYVPSGCEFTVTIDTSRGQRFIGPLVKK